MDFQLNLPITSPLPLLQHQDKVLLMGSCFTEHISTRMEQGGMRVMANPNGILFNPVSVANSLQSYLDRKVYTPEALFLLNEVWHNWDFHSRFSAQDASLALEQMNGATKEAADFLPDADWLLLTFGSAFQYITTDQAQGNAGGIEVANCHRAPAKWFKKQLLSIDRIVAAMQEVLQHTRKVNPNIKIAFTISPVRHIREGLQENNRSKARLIEAVHELCSLFDHCFYFPAYELVIDVLRDYRFYDIDMVHPNYAATQYVWEQFVLHWMHPDAGAILPQFQEVHQARQHRPRFPDSLAHQKFKQAYYQRAMILKKSYPYAELGDALQYFAV